MNSTEDAGNLSSNERIWSAVIGTALPLLMLRRGSPLLNMVTAAAGVGLIRRAFTGQCAVKAALASDGNASGKQNYFTQDYVEERADPMGVQEGG